MTAASFPPTEAGAPAGLRRKSSDAISAKAAKNCGMTRIGIWLSGAGAGRQAKGRLKGPRQWPFTCGRGQSTLVSLSKVLAERIQAQKDPRRMQTYVNNVQAQPYKFVTMESDAERLARHIDPNLPQGLIPDWAIALTLAVDMQRNHFWFSVAAHGLEPERIHILDYGRVQSFEEVEALAFQNRYEFADGISFGIWRGALDTGGGLDPPIGRTPARCRPNAG